MQARGVWNCNYQNSDTMTKAIVDISPENMQECLFTWLDENPLDSYRVTILLNCKYIPLVRILQIKIQKACLDSKLTPRQVTKFIHKMVVNPRGILWLRKGFELFRIQTIGLFFGLESFEYVQTIDKQANNSKSLA